MRGWKIYVATVLTLSKYMVPLAGAGEAPALPEPVPVAGATVYSPHEGAPRHHVERGHKSCLEKIKDWVCYRPRKCTKCGEFTRFSPPQPPLYTYFQDHPCHEGCGQKYVKEGSGGLGERYGFCASGHRMFALETGHGFGLVDGPGRMK